MIRLMMAAIAAWAATPVSATIYDLCRDKQAALFNQASVRPLPVTPVRAVYVFDLAKANPRELKHIISPPLGSQERYHLESAGGQQTLTYVTGLVGPAATVGHEIQTMCLREQDDGFRLRTIRLIGRGVEAHVGPDAAVPPTGQTVSISSTRIR